LREKKAVSENPRSERSKGPVKRKPRWDGKRNVGIAANIKLIELATPYALAITGPVSKNVKIVEGAASALMVRKPSLIPPLWICEIGFKLTR
jgi:hypothetical protein